MTRENLQITAGPGTREGTGILCLNGPLNIHTIFEFQNAVRANSPHVLIVDFSGVPYVDSAGLGAVVGAYVAAQKAQGRVALTGMNEQMRALAQMTRFSELLATFTDVAEAETALR